jgi:hypothetical protein
MRDEEYINSAFPPSRPISRPDRGAVDRDTPDLIDQKTTDLKTTNLTL